MYVCMYMYAFTMHSELRACPSYRHPPRRRCPDKGGLSVPINVCCVDHVYNRIESPSSPDLKREISRSPFVSSQRLCTSAARHDIPRRVQRYSHRQDILIIIIRGRCKASRGNQWRTNGTDFLTTVHHNHSINTTVWEKYSDLQQKKRQIVPGSQLTSLHLDLIFSQLV